MLLMQTHAWPCYLVVVHTTTHHTKCTHQGLLITTLPGHANKQVRGTQSNIPALVAEHTLVLAEGNVAERRTRTAGRTLEVGTMVSDRIDWVGRLAEFVQVLQMCRAAYLWGKGGKGQPLLVVAR